MNSQNNKRKNNSKTALKTVITTASIAATIGGWALLARDNAALADQQDTAPNTVAVVGNSPDTVALTPTAQSSVPYTVPNSAASNQPTLTPTPRASTSAPTATPAPSRRSLSRSHSSR